MESSIFPFIKLLGVRQGEKLSPVSFVLYLDGRNFPLRRKFNGVNFVFQYDDINCVQN